jgi:hypothetical protein
VLQSIYLHDQLRTVTGEIDDISTQRYLTPEVEALLLKGAELAPEETFGFRGFASETSCTFDGQL